MSLLDTFWHRIGIGVRRNCNDLVPYGDVFPLVQNQRRTNRGIIDVPLEAIVGSVGRYRDYTLHFAPRRETQDARWESVAAAYAIGIRLPPVNLYKIGDAYFVEDGNHRVSVAQRRGHETITAHVIEITATSLTPESTCQRLGFKIRLSDHC